MARYVGVRVSTGKSSALYSHFSGQIDGFLTAGGVGLPNVPIFVAYSVTGGKTWVPLTSVNTDDKGVFSATWMPDVTGDYLIKASWDGDATYSEATTTVNFAVAQFQEKTVFSITSNSTISALSFDSNQSKLSFGVTGPNGTTGYVNLYIPKSLITDISSLKVYLDQNLLDNTYSDSGDSWVVLFNYNHSSHMVTVNLSSKSATGADNTTGWFPVLELAVASVIIIIAVVASVMLRRRKKSTKSV